MAARRPSPRSWSRRLPPMRSGDASLYPPRAGAPRVEVFVVTNVYHSGLIVPREALAEAARRRSLPALAAVTARFAAYERLEFGWGDEGFYTQVPTTAELTTALALRALFLPGNPSVLHVVGLSEPSAAGLSECRSGRARRSAKTGFARLAAMLDATFARNGARRRRSKSWAAASTGQACSTAPSGPSTCSGSAITGSPTCSMRRACRPRRCWPPWPQGLLWDLIVARGRCAAAAAY